MLGLNPALRMFMLLSNVYDTYKVLKFPPPSSRGGDRPSTRALTQRKRDMKGCLAVWIVWTCFLMYERLVERIVCIFIPFYSEIKMVFVIFLTLTKARSAEPIYLHILRPLIKPYVPILDVVLDVACGLGDFVLSLVLFPIHYALNWWRGSPSEANFVSDEDEVSASRDSAATAVDEPRSTKPPSAAGPPRHLSESEFASDCDRGHVVEEWRKYPPFPSAYPPTPLPPQNPILISPQQPTSISLAPVAESRSIWLPPKTPLNPGFISSSSDEDSIEKEDPTGPGGPLVDDDDVRDEAIEIESDDDTEGQQGVDQDEDEDEEEGDDDSFNVTLQTPMAPYGSLKTRLAARSVREPIEIQISESSSSSSPAGSTILAGLERPQSMRTAGSTDSSSSLSISEPQRSSQRTVRKKPQPKVAERDFLRPKAGANDDSSAKRPVAKPLVSSSLPHLPSKASSLDLDEDDEQPESESDAAANPDFELKRRRLGAPQTVNGRPTTRATAATKAKTLKTAASASQLKPPTARTSSRAAQKEAPTQYKSTRSRGGIQAKPASVSRPSSESR